MERYHRSHTSGRSAAGHRAPNTPTKAASWARGRQLSRKGPFSHTRLSANVFWLPLGVYSHRPGPSHERPQRLASGNGRQTACSAIGTRDDRAVPGEAKVAGSTDSGLGFSQNWGGSHAWVPSARVTTARYPGQEGARKRPQSVKISTFQGSTSGLCHWLVQLRSRSPCSREALLIQAKPCRAPRRLADTAALAQHLQYCASA